ncbi:hypothetical protein HNO89_003855 [Sporosarcina luteola]|nr:hypothetical protein [Sporosarcina luteola]
MKEPDYKKYLYFAFKKAKHFVTMETSFVEHTEIIFFEQSLDKNIERLSKLLQNPDELSNEIEAMKGHLYFFPKSFGSKGEPRVRPKVVFPFEYQILWTAIILVIGEWFDTNERVKNTFSICNQNIRKQFDWMVPWSFNGRIKRLKSAETTENALFESSYIHYNNNSLYEGHQMALKKFDTYRIQITKKMLANQTEIYRGDLDIQEFFPTLKIEKVKEALNNRFDELDKIKNFNNDYFNILSVRKILDALFELRIDYPDINKLASDYKQLLLDYYRKINPHDKREFEIKHLVDFLNSTLPLDLIASNFLSNCALNYFVDKEIEKELIEEVFILRYTDDYIVLATDEKKLIKLLDESIS